MRRLFLVFVFGLGFSSSAFAETVHVGVNGMVCAFCAKGIESSFKKEAALDSVQVDMDAKQVTLVMKQGQLIKDDVITKIITDSGYAVTEIKHSK